MSGKKRIGELLVEQGLITPAQLDRALTTQLMLGGHLGTSLVELGFIEEDALAEALGRALGLRHVTRGVLEGLPQEVIRLLKPEIAERYRAIPLRKGLHSLHVAVITPRDVQSLSTRTGLRIVPWIAPETRVLEALEAYYGVPRPRRFLTLSATSTAPIGLRATARSPLSPTGRTVLHAPAGRPTRAAKHDGATVERTASRSSAAAAVATPAPRPVAAPDLEATPWIAAADDAAGQPTDPSWSSEEVSMLLSHVDSREELATIVVDYAAQHMAGCVLFGVRDLAAFVLEWRGMRITPRRAAELEFPVVRGSIFQLLDGEPLYCGPLPERPETDAFYATLERSKPAEVLLLPIHLEDRLIALLYGEGTAERPIGIDVADYLQLAQKVAMALEIVILKLKIRAG